MEKDKQAIEQILHTLETLILGKKCGNIELSADMEELNKIIELVNTLASNVTEISDFAHSLSMGNLDVPVPGRRNYMAAALKELHSQLGGFVWSVEQLAKGKIVDYSGYSGEMSTVLYQLIKKISTFSVQENKDTDNDVILSNSWKDHHIILGFDFLPHMVIEVDSTGNIVFSNSKARKLLGEKKQFTVNDLHCHQSVIKALAEITVTGHEFPVVREVYDEEDNQWFQINSEQIQFVNDQVLILHIVDDISDWKQSEKRLKITATTDALTKVYSRNVGIEELERIVKAVDRQVKCCAAFIDVDNLKSINDTYGHNDGDYAVKTIAGVLAGSVRDEDIVSRFGGDEFMIVFKNCSFERAVQILARMYKKIDYINGENAKPYVLSFSHGLVEIKPGQYKNTGEIISEMDTQMYEEKRKKKREAAQ